MAFPIIPKRRSGATGNPTSLELGELATNTATGELFLGGDGGVMLLNPPTSAGTTVTERTGDGTTVAFTFTGYNGTSDGGYLVSVGGIDQPPSKYSISSTNGGTITFVEAPVAGELISIRAIVAGSGGGGDGNATSLQGVPISATAPTNGQTLQYNAENNEWEPVSNAAPVTVTYLIVGGGGGATGAGGGAGGVISGSLILPVGETLTVTVGAGGTGVVNYGQTGNSGSASSLTTELVALGGGAGGAGNPSGPGFPGEDGGSGGGGGATGVINQNFAPGGLGTTGQGNAGGLSPCLAAAPCGGGGGAGEAGGDASASTGGNGGDGLPSSITGQQVYYGGGGGGSCGTGSQGTGGLGGGGNGVVGPTGAVNGEPNTGGGGGGANSTGGVGGNGGSGVVILSLPAVAYTQSQTGSPTVTYSGQNVILTFTSSGSYTN